MIGLAKSLEQLVAQSAVRQHRAVRINKQQHLHRIFPRLFIDKIQKTCILTRLINGSVHIKLRLFPLHTGRVLAQLSKGHLKTADVQNIILTEITEIPFSCNLHRRLVTAFSSYADSLLVIAAPSHGRSSSCPDPVISSVVLFLLLLNTLIKHLQQLVQLTEKVIAVSFVIQVSLPLSVTQPLPEFLRQVLRRLNIPEILRKDSIKLIVVRFCLNDNAAAQIIKSGQGSAGKPLVQSFHQGHPFVHGNSKPLGPEQIKKL